MATINPYINFEGNCEEAFHFYKSVFGGEFTYIGRYKDMPPTEGMPVSKDDENKIMHIALPVSKETILMGADVSGGWGSKNVVGNNISISITAQSEADANKFFNGLSSGGKVTMPLNKTFWGAYFGMLTDKYGINWLVSHDANQQN